MSRGFEGLLEGQIRTLFEVGAVGLLTDGQLLDRFLEDQGPSGSAAFQSLVMRHGPMVLGVCRKILRDCDATEDAFQATFLILARKASSIRSREAVAAWLAGVARKVASRSRSDTERRRTLERRLADTLPSPHSVEPNSSAIDEHELDILLREVDRLPDRLREPVVLFYLEGLSYERAAASLRTTEATIRGRLARARDRLRTRLQGQGLAMAWLSTDGGPRALVESIPLRLVEQTVQGAASITSGRATAEVISTSVTLLMEGVLKSMGFAKWKMTLAVLSMAGLISVGAAVQAQGRPKSPIRPAAEPRQIEANADPQADSKAIGDMAGGRVVRSVEVTKDCMTLAYMPEWRFGNVDNIGVANNDGGVRTLVDWPDVSPAEAKSPDLKFYLAFYSRKTTAKPKPGSIATFEVSTEWAELTSWNIRPTYEEEPSSLTRFVPGEGWKLFDVTDLVKKQEGKSGKGVMLRFMNEDKPGSGDWSGYMFVSREGKDEWAKRRPKLIVVEPTKK